MDLFSVSFPKLGLDFSLAREAFVIGDFSVYWYAILIAIGALLAVIYTMTQAKKYGVDPDKLLDLVIVGLIFGIIGARAYYVLFNLDNYTSLAQVFNIRDGGLAIYGGLILGIIAALIMSRINKTRFLPSLDIAVGGFLIGQSIGRWGNFVNQEAFGVNTDSIFGMYSDKTHDYLQSVSWELFLQGVEVDPSAPVHPCFLYESVWCIIGFLLIVLVYRKHRKFDGEIALFYAAWYGTGRAFIEGIRTDSLMLFGFRVSQVLSIILAVGAVLAIVLIRLSINKKRFQNPEYLKLYVDTDESKAQFMLSDEAVLEKSEEALNSSIATLERAEKLLAQDSDEEKDSLEALADKYREPEAVAADAKKLIELALTQAGLADTLLERFKDIEQDDISEDEAYVLDADDLSDDEESQDDVEYCLEQIESLKEFIAECFELIEEARQTIELKALEQDEVVPEKEEEQEEVLDSVSDEADEMDIPSPHANK